jgi:tungstate transport system ATP-binding protein
MSAVIEIRDLRIIRNGMTALDVPHLSFEEGRISSLIGPNGAGKSTLLLSVMRLVRPDSGEMLYRGKKILQGKSVHNARRRMAMVFQEPLLFSASVYNNIASGLKMRGAARNEIRKAVGEAMDLLSIAHLARRPAGALSGGEAQRVNLARALATGPEVLLMDEPFSSLDAPSREAFIRDLERIIRGRGITVIFATHDRSEAIRLADEIIVMNEGRIVQSGKPNDITQFPASEFVASFMGTETIISGAVEGSEGGVFSVSVNGASIEAVGLAEPGSTVTFCIHPDNIVFSHSPSESSARNSFRGKVVKVVPMGLFQKVYFDCGFTLVAYVTGQSIESLDIRPGKELTATFKATSVHVIKVQK